MSSESTAADMVVGGASWRPGDAELLREITSRSMGQFLFEWLNYQHCCFRGYASDALELVRAHRPRHVGTAKGVLDSWLVACQEVLNELGAHVSSLPPAAPRGADGPQNGDVRSVHREVQVFLDGGWYALGPRRKP